MPQLDFWKWAIAAFCAFSVGVAKTGVPGLGILAVPLFVLAVGDARLSAGWLLPLLVVADAYAAWYYRKQRATRALFSLLPWVLCGWTIGAVVLRYPENVIRPIVGAIIFSILILFLLRRRGIDPTPVGAKWSSGVYGTAAGFATMVANASGPIMNVYLLSQKLPREQFVATGAWFFLAVNVSKLPVYAWQKLISKESLIFDAALVPAVLAGALVGRRVLKIMPESVFIASVTVLAFIATILLFLPR